MVRITKIVPGTIAEALDLEIGSRIVRINGEPVRDTIDFRFLEAEALLEIEVQPARGGVSAVYEIEKDPGEHVGVVPAPDVVRECANECVFCFIDGNPPGVRDSLGLRDDDFRLSFSYGSYVTLTNLGPRGFRRLIEQRLSPLYVSVHATQPEIRMRMLGVPRGGDIVEKLRQLTDHELEVHTQVVLCPGWNDGAHLERTLDDLWALGPGVLSVSVVPVGLTRYNLHRPVRLLTAPEAAAAIRQVDVARRRAGRERGTGWAYVADELFFNAGAPIPHADYYDDWPLVENGVGAVRRFLDDFADGVDPLPRMRGSRVVVITGMRMAPLIAALLPRLSAATGARFEVVAVENRMFGPTVTTAGLLAGEDIARALTSHAPFDLALLPAEALNEDGVFIDDLPLERLAARFEASRFVPGHRLAAALAER